MTDTATTTPAPTAPTSVSISLDMLTSKVTDIKAIDSQIAAASGSADETRKAVISQLTDGVADKVQSLLPQMLSQLKGLDPATLLGILTAFPSAVSTELEPITNKLVDDAVASQAASNPTVDVNALKEKRKAEVELFRAIKTMLGSLGVDVSTVEEPKRAGGGRTGGTGTSKSGKNKENYQFTMDGKNRPSSQNTFSSLAYYSTEGYFMTGDDAFTLKEEKDSRLGASQLRALLVAAGINYGADDTWEYTLPNGKKIGAVRMAPEAETPTETTDTAPVAEPAAATA